VDETDKVSSTICCQDQGRLRDRVDSDRLAVSVAVLPHWIERESFLATSAFMQTNSETSAYPSCDICIEGGALCGKQRAGIAFPVRSYLVRSSGNPGARTPPPLFNSAMDDPGDQPQGKLGSGYDRRDAGLLPGQPAPGGLGKRRFLKGEIENIRPAQEIGRCHYLELCHHSFRHHRGRGVSQAFRVLRRLGTSPFQM
jgi:hypothetical protein